MRFLEDIDRLLQERVLMSELTVGFELEGYCDNSIRGEIEDKMRSFGWAVYDDGSIRNPPQTYAFEADMGYGPVTPKWMKTVVDRLEELFNLGVRTNKSCGFHAHFGFGNLKKKSSKVSKIENALLVDRMARQGTIEEFSDFRGIKQFEEEYAPKDVAYDLMENISHWNEQYRDKILSRAEYLKRLTQTIDIYTTHKLTLLRVHSSGTLEWRGLRGVLKEDMDWTSKLIKEYIYRHVYKFGKEVADLLTEISAGELWPGTDVTKQNLIEYDDQVIAKRSKKVGLTALEKTYPDVAKQLKVLLDERDESKVVPAVYENREVMFPIIRQIQNPSAAKLELSGSRNAPEFTFRFANFESADIVPKKFKKRSETQFNRPGLMAQSVKHEADISFSDCLFSQCKIYPERLEDYSFESCTIADSKIFIGYVFGDYDLDDVDLTSDEWSNAASDVIADRMNASGLRIEDSVAILGAQDRVQISQYDSQG